MQGPTRADLDELLMDMFVKEDVPDVFLSRKVKAATAREFSNINKCVVAAPELSSYESPSSGSDIHRMAMYQRDGELV